MNLLLIDSALSELVGLSHDCFDPWIEVKCDRSYVKW